jgi:hypothetical protein
MEKKKEINAVLLIIWSVINILIFSYLFAIPGLVFAIKYKQQGKKEFRTKAIIFNVVSTIIGIGVWISIILYIILYLRDNKI